MKIQTKQSNESRDEFEETGLWTFVLGFFMFVYQRYIKA